MQLLLELLNQRNVRANSGAVPPALAEMIDAPTYSRSVAYALAKGKFHIVELSYDLLILIAALFSGILPRAFDWLVGTWGSAAWIMAGFLFLAGLCLSLLTLPLDWYAQFRLEERFGFNTTSQKLWWLDRLKGFLLAIVVAYPLLLLIFKLVQWTGSLWWLWAWATVFGFQMLMAVLAPVLILPIFNKFTPLPEGSLRQRLLNLATRTQFQARNIQVMDGSKRSRHSNAFFTGFGAFRKIVLFDTLIQQLNEVELEAVLAHEIGHYKKKHIPKMLVASAMGLLVAFYLAAWLAQQPWFYEAFGFAGTQLAPALLIFGLLSGMVTFWIFPLAYLWSRRYEYQADAYAAQTMGEPKPLIGALRKLSEKNLSNLTPHSLYSSFYYSHPTLMERERALQIQSRKQSTI